MPADRRCDAFGQRLVDRADHLLAGLERAEGRDHVDHRAGGVGVRALEGALAHRAGGLAAGGAGDVGVADLLRVVDVEDPDLRWGRRVPSAPTRTGPPLRPTTWLPVRSIERALRRERRTGRCACSARPAESGRRTSPRPDDREVERLAGLARGRGGRVGGHGVDLRRRARARRPICPVTEFARSMLAEAALGRAVGLVAGRRRVREVVGDLILADHLGQHPGRGDVEASLHLGTGVIEPCRHHP